MYVVYIPTYYTCDNILCVYNLITERCMYIPTYYTCDSILCVYNLITERCMYVPTYYTCDNILCVYNQNENVIHCSLITIYHMSNWR